MSRETDEKIARQGRMAALVIAGSMCFWIVMQWLGPRIGLPGRYAFLVDFAVLAALFWALVVTYQIWRKRRDNEG
ncbi:hypothetical protein E0K89_008880 [Aquicoccus sp. SCR17]|nr:hypothetical protein [Carideicomes alvinocaridis]